MGCQCDPTAAIWNQEVPPRAAVVYIADLKVHVERILGQESVGLERRGGKVKGLNERRMWARWEFWRGAERRAHGSGWLRKL